MKRSRVFVLSSSTCLFLGLGGCGGLPEGIQPETPEIETSEQAIVNGTKLPADRFRAALVWTTSNFVSGGTGALCSGTAISSRHILTAAHCVTAFKTETRSDGGEEYETDVFLPHVDPALKNGSTLVLTRERNVSVDIKKQGWKKARITNLFINPSWIDRARSSPRPEFLDMITDGRPDLAVIVVAEDLGGLLPGLKPAQVDTRPLPKGAPVTMTGYGCEKEGFDQNNEFYDNWGGRVTAEFANTKTLDAADAKRLYDAYETDAEWEASAPLEFFLGYARGTTFIRGPISGRTTPGLCPGDSGGGLFRGGDENAVVGVGSGNLYISGPGQAVLGHYARFAPGTKFFAAGWLQGLLPKDRVLR